MNRFHQILVGVLVVQLALIGVVFWPRKAPAAGAPLLGKLKADDVTAVVIHDDKGNSIKLGKQGDQWVLPDMDDYPADSSKITPLLTKLTGLTNDRLVTKTAASHKRLQVADDDFVRRLDLTASDGTTQTLYLGSSAGARTVHVRVSGQDEVYLAVDVSTWEMGADAASWINTTYFNVPQKDVVAMTLSNANGQWSFEKDAGHWTMQGLASDETLNTNNVTGLLNRVIYVRMEKPLGKTEDASYGMAQPSAVVTLKTNKDNQEKTYTLAIGAKTADGKSYVVKSSESPYYVQVTGYTVKNLVEKTRKDFLQLPPTPTPTPGS